MTEEDLINYLKNNLSIQIDFDEAGTAYWCGDHSLTVTLKLNDKIISESRTTIPNNNRTSEY